MSRLLIPHCFGRNFWDMWDYPEKLVDQHFGLGLPLDTILDTEIVPAWYRLRPLVRGAQRKAGDEKGYSAVKNDDAEFEVKMDCSHFAPEELSVKVIDGSLVVSGKHEEKKDEHGFISREFTRKYVLPKDVELDKITTSLNKNGVLTLTAPKKQREAVKDSERVIPITMAPKEAALTNGGDEKSKEKD